MAKYNHALLFRVYELRKSGESFKRISDAIGVSLETFGNWRKKKPEMAAAIKAADKARGKSENGSRSRSTDTQSFVDYVYKHLSPDLQHKWAALKNAQQGGLPAIRSLLQGTGTPQLQRLFVHALVHFNFNPSRAMKSVGVSKAKVDKWLETDPDFARILDEIEYHRCNLYEEMLVKGVQMGEASLIKFANETKNQDRGYRKVVQSEINMTSDVNTIEVGLDTLIETMPIELKAQVLAHMRSQGFGGASHA